MRIISYILILMGLVIYGYSLTLKPYTDEEEFNSKYMEISGENRSEQFFELRDEYLTLKFPLTDYGLTATILGFITLFIFYRGWTNFRTLKSKEWVVAIAILAVLTTIMGYVADLFNEMVRGSAPHWADSLGIPLMSVPPLLIILLIWSGLNLTGLKGDFKPGVPVSTFRFRSTNYWYLIISILTSVVIITMIVDGYFWMLIPGFLWLYFYVSLLIGKHVAKIEKRRLREQLKLTT